MKLTFGIVKLTLGSQVYTSKHVRCGARRGAARLRVRRTAPAPATPPPRAAALTTACARRRAEARTALSFNGLSVSKANRSARRAAPRAAQRERAARARVRDTGTHAPAQQRRVERGACARRGWRALQRVFKKSPAQRGAAAARLGGQRAAALRRGRAVDKRASRARARGRGAGNRRRGTPQEPATLPSATAGGSPRGALACARCASPQRGNRFGPASLRRGAQARRLGAPDGVGEARHSGESAVLRSLGAST